MKKSSLMFGISLLFAASLLGSCQKEYVCRCSKTYTGENGSVTRNYGVYTYRENRLEAGERCAGNEATGSDLGGNYTINCYIDD